MVVIAFSGVGNTGKSTIIQQIKEKYQHSIPTIVLGENARDAISRVGKENRAKLQQEIFLLEQERAERLKRFKDDYGLVLVDRPRTDNLAYLHYNVVTNRIEEPVKIQSIDCDVYNHIISFNEPIKLGTTFEDYSLNHVILMNFMYHANRAFEAKLHFFTNAKEEGDQVMALIDRIINEQEAENQEQIQSLGN